MRKSQEIDFIPKWHFIQFIYGEFGYVVDQTDLTLIRYQQKYQFGKISGHNEQRWIIKKTGTKHNKTICGLFHRGDIPSMDKLEFHLNSIR